ncbi:barnase inhibitor [Bacillus cereus]|uniref:barstar family protein n=1 Tax=Bacillus cereus TaxID=1396 RepID=UPI000BF77628|nr:barstar family protein [Bacillus cereus]PEY87921.1 barnase inhibitor [Bacillus cereus]PGV99677.1 barnase inhibitor [Bacillus cereus]PGY27006.1 barnase inhibitor [Bacillus cereus]
MDEVVLDGEKFDNLEQMHIYLQKILDIPDFYGHNLDALWDFLTGIIEIPLTIRWINFKESEIKLGEDCKRLLQLFREVEDEKDDFKLKIE